MSTSTGKLGETSIADGIWSVDTRHSEIGFAVKAMWGLTTVRGTFGAYRGGLAVQGSVMTGGLAIDARTLCTGNLRRDRHLRSTDFFDVERHPEILLSLMARATNSGGLAVAGDLRIGITSTPLRLALDVQWTDENTLRLYGSTSISRSAAGVAWNTLGTIRDAAVLYARLTLIHTDQG